MDIPIGSDHLRMIAGLSEQVRQATELELSEYTHELRITGTSLSALYLAATCHRKCHGGSHVLESMSGRVYNLGVSAYILICRGLYDESVNLMRNIGEISNLIWLSVLDKDSLRNWLEADRGTRLREFSPVKVRLLLEAHSLPMVADQNWYTTFCDKYTHVGPNTKPNQHNDEGLPHVGGVLQSAGLKGALGELATVLSSVAMPICRYFELNDVFEMLSRAMDSEDGDGKSEGGKAEGGNR